MNQTPGQLLKNEILVKTFGESKVFEIGRYLRHIDLFPKTVKNRRATYKELALLIYFCCIAQSPKAVAKTFLESGANQFAGDPMDGHDLITDLESVLEGNYKVEIMAIGRFVSSATYQGKIGEGLPSIREDVTLRNYYAKDIPEYGANWQVTLNQKFFDELIASLTSA